MPNGSKPSAGLLRGTSSLGVRTRRRPIPSGPRPLPRTPTSLRRTPRPSHLPTTTGHRMCGTRTGRGMPSCRAETAGGGEPNLADRPSLLPLGMERAGVRPVVPPPPQTSTYPPGSCFSPKILPRSWSARCFRAVPKGKKLPSGAAQLFSARGTFQARATRTMVRCTACAPRLRLAVHERAGQGRKDERA